MKKSLIEHILAHSKVVGECWIWNGYYERKRFGTAVPVMRHKRKRAQPVRHVFAFLPPTVRLHKGCTTPGCQNPAHYHYSLKAYIHHLVKRFDTTFDELTAEDVIAQIEADGGEPPSLTLIEETLNLETAS